MKKQNLVAFAYARYSSNNQREESIDAQLRAIREYCDRNNIILIESFQDEALTGKNDNRDDFQRMVNGIMKGHYKVDMILVHKFNRFARNKFDSALYKKRLKDNGVRVVSVTQNIDDTPEGAMLESIIEAMDEYYSANLALEVRKGLRENALKGRHTGGRVLYGFSLDEKGCYQPNKNAEIVKRIFTEFAAGEFKTDICGRLNREGILNQNGKTFNVRTIYDMLRNEKYIGNYIYTLGGNETIRLDGIIEPIIDIDLWDKVQAISNEPVKKRMRNKKTSYLLTGKTFCGCCGMQICGNGSKRMRNGILRYYYKCVGKAKHQNGCKNTLINKEWLEARVLSAVINAVMSDEQINKLAALTFAEIESLKKAPAISTEALKDELKAIAKKQEKLTDLYLDGEIDKTILDERNGKMKSRRHEIEKQMEMRKAVDEINTITEDMVHDYIAAYMKQIQKHNNSENGDFMRSVFTTFVDKIVITGDEVTVFVNADFSFFPVGDSLQLAGVFHRLTPTQIQTSFERPTHTASQF